MSFNVGVLNAGVTLDDSDYINKLKGLDAKSESTFQKIAKYAATYLTLRAVVGFAQKSIQTFSDLEEETNKFNVVFQGLGEQTSKTLKQMREDFGLSELAAKKMLAGTGDILTGVGFDRQTALDLSTAAAQLGADIASFSNYSGGAEGAAQALTKAMLGETESAKMLGVVIRQDDEAYKALVEQAMTTGVTIEATGKTFKVTTEQQAKAVAALALAYQQSPNAIGDFVRSQDSIANQSRILKNNLEQLFATVGSDQANAFAIGLAGVNGLIKAYNDMSPVTRKLTNDFLLMSAALLIWNKANIGGKIKGFIANTNVEIAQFQEKERVKRAELEKTKAVQAAAAAFQERSVAQVAVAEAKAALNTIQAQKAIAQAKGDSAGVAAATAAETQARASLQEATIKLSAAERDYQEKRSNAVKASIAYKTASEALPAVLNAIAISSQAAGVAGLFSAGAFRAAATAVKGFWASLGPIGIAVLAAIAAYEAATIALGVYNEKLQENAKKAADAAEEAKNYSDAQKAAMENSEKNFDEIREIAKYEQLTASEKERVVTLLEQEGMLVDKNAKTVKEMVGATKDQADAIEDAVDLRRKEMLEMRKQALLQEQLRNQEAIDANDKTRAGAWQEFFSGITFGAVESGEESDARVDAENKKYFQRNDQIAQQLAAIREEEEKLGSVQHRRAKAAAKNAKIERNAINEINKMLRDRKFDKSESVGKLDILDKEIFRLRQVLPKSLQNASISKLLKNTDMLRGNQMEALRQIISLAQENNKIYDESDQAISRERKEYQKYLEERKRGIELAKIDKEISDAKERGDVEGARRIMEMELERAQKKADEYKKKYEDFMISAYSDDLFTEAERRQAEYLRRVFTENLDDADKWRRRIDDSDKRDRENQQVAGGFSVTILKYQLEASKPAEETARNTKTLVREVRGIRNDESTIIRY